MYPDTDLPPIPLGDERVKAIRDSLPLKPWERQAQAEKMGVGPDLAERLGRHRAWELFVHLAERLESGGSFDAAGLASLLLDRSTPRPRSLAVAGHWWEGALDRVAAGDVVPEGLWTSEDDIPARLDDTEARRLFEEAVAASGSGGPDDTTLREHWLMGRVMPGLRGRVPGRTVRTWVKEVVA